MRASFDVFLSYNSKDRSVVQTFADALRAAGINPWLDIEQLTPGYPWLPLLEKAVVACRTAAVLVGPAGLGPWQEPEMRVCLDEVVRRKLPVLPTLLPGSGDSAKSTVRAVTLLRQSLALSRH